MKLTEEVSDLKKNLEIMREEINKGIEEKNSMKKQKEELEKIIKEKETEVERNKDHLKYLELQKKIDALKSLYTKDLKDWSRTFFLLYQEQSFCFDGTIDEENLRSKILPPHTSS